MRDSLQLNDYKQQVADFYSRRSPNYDIGDWHPRIAHRLVNYAQLQPGHWVLDLATGTGMVAIAAAQAVGSNGHVTGVDISTGMLAQARRKITALGLTNVELIQADAETLEFAAESCDRIFCSAALIWMSDLVEALRLWHQFLKPGGLIGFHAFANNSFVVGTVAQQVFERYGISLLFNQRTGTIEKCYALLEQAGYQDIDIRMEPDGYYLSLDSAKSMWPGNGSLPTPGQHPNPISQLSEAQLAQARAEFDAALTARQTEKGIWNDTTVFYAFGRKAR